MLTLVLVRHGETALNREGRYQGHLDPDLTERGVEQVREAREALGALGVDVERAVTWTSDLLRARRTGEILLPGRRWTADPRLRELRFGAWEGQTSAELAVRDGARLRAWMEDPDAVAPPGGERLADLRARLADWSRTLPSDGTAIVVGHGGPARIILARMMGLPAVWRWEGRPRLAPGRVVAGEIRPEEIR